MLKIRLRDDNKSNFYYVCGTYKTPNQTYKIRYHSTGKSTKNEAEKYLWWFQQKLDGGEFKDNKTLKPILIMNTNTGEVFSAEDFKKMSQSMTEDELNDFVEVDPNELTKKQMAQNLVSLFDHRSTVGKQLTNARSKKKNKAKRRTAKKSRKKNRR